jgi:hypothetical protein
LFDNFSDYNGNWNEHIKAPSTVVPRRWLGTGGLSLDPATSFSGDYSLRMVFGSGTGDRGAGIAQWVDTRALRGEKMIEDQPMTGHGNLTSELARIRESEHGPANQIPVYDVRHREGGYEALYTRTAVMFSPTFSNTVHTGISYSGGYNSRPNSNAGAPTTPPNPGSTAGYRSNGFDRFIAGLEVSNRGQHTAPQPGFLFIYFYGAEQQGLHGNWMFSDGVVYPSTGGENHTTRHINNRVEGVNDGFIRLPNFNPPLGKWFELEYYIQLNTVEGTPPRVPNNHYYPVGQQSGSNAESFGVGHVQGIGPQPVPEGGSGGYKVHADGIIRVWVDGVLVMNYEDVVFRHTNEMIIDQVSIGASFRNNPNPIDVWYDNIVVATEYIGPVNRTGIDPNKSLPKPPLDIGAENVDVTRGETHQFNAAFNYPYATVSEQRAGEFPAVLAGGTGNNTFGIAYDGLINRSFGPGKVILIEFESSYATQAATSAALNIINHTHESGQGIGQNIKAEWGPDNTWVQIHFADFASLVRSTDFGSAGQLDLVNTGSESITIKSISVGTPRHAAVWSLTGNRYPGTVIDRITGLLTVDPAETSPIITIRAEMAGYPLISETVTVNIQGIATFTYVFRGNGGLTPGSADSIEGFAFHENEYILAGANSFTREGYALTSWNTQPNGSGDTYWPGSSVREVSGGLTLYAQWSELSPSINIHPSATEASPGETVNFKGHVIPAADRVGAEMDGWGGNRELIRSWGAGTDRAMNGLWGQTYNLGANFRPGMAMIVYYDAPYSPEYTSRFVRLAVTNLDFANRREQYSHLAEGWNIVPAVNFDPHNRFLMIYFDELTEFLRTADLSTPATGPMRLIITLAGPHDVGFDPIVINEIRLWTADTVTWSVTGNSSADTAINSSGLLTIGAGETARTLTVRSALANDPNIYSEVTITVTGN